jgi:Fe2+ transport system protein FeoA
MKQHPTACSLQEPLQTSAVEESEGGEKQAFPKKQQPHQPRKESLSQTASSAGTAVAASLSPAHKTTPDSQRGLKYRFWQLLAKLFGVGPCADCVCPTCATTRAMGGAMADISPGCTRRILGIADGCAAEMATAPCVGAPPEPTLWRSLDHMPPGKAGCVREVNGVGILRRRLLEMGVLPGTELRVERIAPLGDPIEIRLRGYALSLRRAEASHILVEYRDTQK